MPCETVQTRKTSGSPVRSLKSNFSASKKSPASLLSKKLKKDFVYELDNSELSDGEESEGFEGIRFLKPLPIYRKSANHSDPCLVIFSSEAPNYILYSYGSELSDSSEVECLSFQ